MVSDMLVEIVQLQIGYLCHSSLGEGGVGLLEGGLAMSATRPGGPLLSAKLMPAMPQPITR